MPSSAIRNFNDPDELGEAVRGAQVEVTISGRGDYTARLSRIDLHRLWMQQLSDGLPRIFHAACWPSRAVINFAARTGPELVMSGTTIPLGAIVRHSQSHDFHQSTSGPTTLASMSLSIEDMASVGSTMAGCDLTTPHDTLIVTPRPFAMARLQRLYAAAEHLAAEAPEVLANADAARGLEQELVQAMAACLITPEIQENRSAQRRHEQIMRRFHAVIEDNIGDAIYVPDLCAAMNVPERTLRTCCMESLNMGPMQFLQRRRLQLARRDLRKADPAVTRVTDIAMRYGFWEFGRFSVAYRHLFGEPPSTTLRRPLA